MGALKRGIGIGLLLFVAVVWAQEEVETILWNPERRLTWEDFKGKPLKTEWAAATTASGISYEFNTSGTPEKMRVEFRVWTEFYPQKSWYRPELCDEVILSHEQLHFDISELFARKMRKQLRQTRFTQDIKAEVRKIYRQILKDLNTFQNQYDHQTNFSRNVEKQLEWNQKIADALASDL